MRNKRNYFILLLGSLLFCVLISALSLALGNIVFSASELFGFVLGKGDTVGRNILLYSRLPRTVACLFAGAGLSASGAVLQNVLANKLASPSIIGVNSGAGLGVTVCCACGVLSGIGVSVCAFAGSLFAVLIISLFSSRISASKTTVILGGVALNSMLGAASEAITVLNPEAAMLTTEFRVGGFSAVSFTRLIPSAIMIAGALLLLFTLSNELDAVSLGDETARSIGLSVRKYRILFLVISALLAGAAVSFAGLLGFIGLIVPHFVRKLAGNESRRLLPLCTVMGAGFVCLCDLISRLVFAPYELPVGILMAVIGGPVFVALLVRTKGGKRHA
ncbi:MAG: FecCD family ABC transporter permease [Acutalibacteraceae bacterium]